MRKEKDLDFIQLKFAELHSPLFLAGTNLGMKLDPAKRSGLVLKYIREYGELHVIWQQELSIVPKTNVTNMVPGECKPHIQQISHAQGATISHAQVETPMSHVHAGFGHGKTGLPPVGKVVL